MFRFQYNYYNTYQIHPILYLCVINTIINESNLFVNILYSYKQSLNHYKKCCFLHDDNGDKIHITFLFYFCQVSATLYCFQLSCSAGSIPRPRLGLLHCLNYWSSFQGTTSLIQYQSHSPVHKSVYRCPISYNKVCITFKPLTSSYYRVQINDLNSLIYFIFTLLKLVKLRYLSPVLNCQPSRQRHSLFQLPHAFVNRCIK